MKILSRIERRRLEDVVASARESAETAARKALHTLGVDEADPPAHLSADERVLRRRLQAQARQLGDREARAGKGHWSIEQLVEKVAYDRLHRMLFARFLAENNLLFSQQHGVPVSLQDCEELAPEMGLCNGWEAAAAFAAQMLPEIFRADDPAGLLTLPPEDEGAMRQLVIQVPGEVFLADDSLGWVYQFWQTRRKDEVNGSGRKIGADELPAVTQLFTEDYMVLFLLHNTLGAWWTARHGGTDLTFDYLRTMEDGTPAAGGFEAWPATARELKVLDPCMGSGHFLVFALPLLAEFRQAEEGLSEKDAFDAVLRDNLFGLELDPRCTQLAVFNLALAAWKRGGYRRLPQMNLACCGLGIHATRDDWMKLANGDRHLADGMGRLHDLFQQAPTLGSLIDPRKVGKDDLFVSGWHDLQPLLAAALTKEKTRSDDELAEMGVTAQGLARAAEILTGRFNLVATNVPYLGRGKQSDTLKDFCEKTYPEAKADLATCFVERCLSLCDKGGTSALVTPQNWLFLGSYRKLRGRLLEDVQWDSVTRLGPHAFETIGGEVVNVVLLTLDQQKPKTDHQF
ncbi:MAG: N-6 DNA methylase, partial [Spirochaetia bacterium]